MSGGDVGTLLYALLVLAVPFLFGVVVGRGVRRPPETFQHQFGSKIICALEDGGITRIQGRKPFRRTRARNW